jgi:hypothetical protein
MDEHKDIGKAFKEQLSELQKSPNPKIWDNIVAELDKKDENKKPLVLWWKLGGIAVTILLLFVIGYKTVTNNKSDNQQIIIKNNQLDSIKKENNAVTKTGTNLKDTLQIDKKTNLKNVLVKNNLKENILEIKNKTDKKQVDSHKKSIQLDKLITANKKEDVAILNKIITNNKLIIKDKIEQETKDEISNNNNITKVEKGNSKIEAIKIVKNKKDIKKKENKKELVAIEDALDIIAEEAKPDKKWEVSIKGAPVFYSSLSGESSLGNDLNNNSTSGDVTYSYGISISYPISKKIKIRTGINNVDLAYKTEQIPLTSTLNAQSLNNTSLESFFETSELGIGSDAFGQGKLDLTQEINYLEIPLEIKYTILDKKLNIETIAGLSTLFLNNDSILIDNDTNIGSVNNLKEVSFTGNFGFGFNYKFNKKLHFNLEPSIKIQFNTYKDNVDYKPYFLGVYTGFSYQF